VDSHQSNDLVGVSECVGGGDLNAALSSDLAGPDTLCLLARLCCSFASYTAKTLSKVEEEHKHEEQVHLSHLSIPYPNFGSSFDWQGYVCRRSS
jgi:hypothetical protein